MRERQAVEYEDSIRYCRVDIQDIPLPDKSMNVVIANMMLCHVPDMEKALTEVRRVMKDGGVFYCATFGEQGPASFVRKALGIPKEDGGVFMLENGASILKNRFSHVTKRNIKMRWPSRTPMT